MADVFSTAERSRIMARVRSTGNKSTELKLIAIMREHGITGWRRGSQLPGRPDFVFRTNRVAVFVDGCFWHGCPRCGSMPATRREYWTAKIARNRARDRRVAKLLRARGWRVVRIWECALREPARVAAQLRRALRPRPHGVESPTPPVANTSAAKRGPAKAPPGKGEGPR